MNRVHTTGFILHVRPYRDNSHILDLLTEAEGRTACLFRGRSQKARSFARYELAWQGRGELKTLSLLEEQSAVVLAAQRLACGFYVNELALKLLPRQIPLEGFFEDYAHTVAALARPDEDLEPLLRGYERSLLHYLGEGLESIDLAALEPEDCYVYEAQRGLRLAGPGERSRGPCVHGETLRELLGGGVQTPRGRQEAKRLLRGLLDHHLQGRRIMSRALFPGAAGQRQENQEP
ncbi:DNA repair protein RecO [Thioalkalivibrio sulfidiphilus HL-EbGr7]|uniref:DNA repair protein RecO n=1 Tax=Thioalkalivibrio sulfidiphilus (strain HL-EbGR7) TaxID=396588 RepID=B8GPL3_THISH|nr:DNA repair protein RecO C-terminal domain-containing protein [Thioalkalivibrio sulfidiphilus]ACL72180.1 DNA repair protein RecO [Thioalkalivibrio sulfidiphilus HL-EbGr7]